MVEVYLNLFPLTVKSSALFAYEIEDTEPQTRNRKVRFRLAANVAKKLSKNKGAVFSIGDRIYAGVPVEDRQYEDTIDIDGTSVSFTIHLSPSDEMSNIGSVEQTTERLLNKLVDWFCHELNDSYFHYRGANYLGQNIFARMQLPLYKVHKININEGILRATRVFGGKLYLLLDNDYRVTWEQSLWEEVKLYTRSVLNKDLFLVEESTIKALNERFGKHNGKGGVRLVGKHRIGEYKLVGFDFGKNPDTPGTAGGLSQREYFSKVYGSANRIQDAKQPLALVKPIRGTHRGETVYHVPELLEFDRVPPRIRRNTRVNKAIVNITKPHPRSRYGSIINLVQGDEFGKSKGLSQDTLIRQFVDFNSKPVCLNADVLPPTQIKMQKDIFAVASETDFFRGIAGKRFHRIPQIDKVILLFNESEKERVLNFYEQLRNLSAGHGLNLPDNPKLLTVQSEDHGEYVDRLAEDHEANLVLSFTQSEDDELYDLLKQELLVKYGVLSQNIAFDKTIDRIEEYRNTGKDGYAQTILTMIAMQICAKLGGAPWAFNEPIYEEGCPILGLDVYHSEDDAEGSDSVVGACAVFDPYGEYLFSDVSSLDITRPVETLNQLIKGAIKHLEDEGKRPNKLLILRSGLNFTQEHKFLYDKEQGELAIIEKALKDCGVPEYVFVLHKKGTSLRMYKKIKEFQVDNPEPGTVIIGTPFDDNEILMISQQTYVGTAEPVMFKVLSRNANMKKLATAIYKLCRHHWSSARTIRVPAPALHADMITHFVRLVLRQRPTSRQVLDRPFYL